MKYDKNFHKFYRETMYQPSINELRQQAVTEMFSRNDRDSEREKPAYGPGEIVLAIILVGSLITLILSAILKMTDLIFASLFVYLVSFALAVILGSNQQFDKVKRKNVRIGGTIALLIILAAAGLYYGNKAGLFTSTISLWFTLGAIATGILGVAAIVSDIVNLKSLNRKCTQEISATCIGYDDKIQSSHGKHHHGQYVITAAVYKFNYAGSEYIVTDDLYYNDPINLPHIGISVPLLVDPDYPYTCKLKGGKTSFGAFIFMGIVLLMFCGGLSTAAYMESGNSGNKLTDKVIAEVYMGTPEFIVTERTVVKVVGDKIYFDEFGGLRDWCHSDFADELYAGQTVIYAQAYDGFPRVFPADSYTYVGEQTVENSPNYTADGRFILTDEYLTEYLETAEYEVYEVTLQRTTTDKWDFIDEDGATHTMTLTSDSSYRYWNVMRGDEFYLVESSNGIAIFGMDKNSYER